MVITSVEQLRYQNTFTYMYLIKFSVIKENNTNKCTSIYIQFFEWEITKKLIEFRKMFFSFFYYVKPGVNWRWNKTDREKNIYSKY